MPIIFFARFWRFGVLPLFSSSWTFLYRLEAMTLIPVTAIIAVPLFVYLLLSRGYHHALFSSKNRPDRS